MPLGLDSACWWMMGLGDRLDDRCCHVGHDISWSAGAHRGVRVRLRCSYARSAWSFFASSRRPLRLVGAILIGCAVIMMIRSPQPDVLIAADATAIAVRTGDRPPRHDPFGADTFAMREWLAADGDPRTPKDGTLGNGINCDDAGCIGSSRRLVDRVVKEN